jgi:glycosyltransferase involved in cell wall biosynthesis
VYCYVPGQCVDCEITINNAIKRYRKTGKQFMKSKEMKVSFILPGRGRSGGVKCTVAVANGLVRRGHKIRILYYKGKVSNRLRDFYLGLCYRGNSDWLGMFEGQQEGFSDINKCNFEDGEIAVASGGWAARAIAGLDGGKIKKVHYIHGVDSPDPNQMKQFWSENVPKIIVASYLEKVIGELLGQDVLALIPNGIDAGEFYPSLPSPRRDGIGTIFGMTIHKDPGTILAVLEILKKQCPDAVQRVFGSCRRPKQLPQQQYVRLPAIEKTRELYSRSKVWFLASRAEGFALPVLEAMSCGCAVVATNCGGPSDMITDGINGFLVEPGDAEGMAKKIRLLLENENLRNKFILESQQTVKKFTWESSIKKFEEVLLSVHHKK